MEDHDRWAGMSTKFAITDARIVAIKEDGGAIVEDGLKLDIDEGRRWCLAGESEDDDGEEDDDDREFLEYHCTFEVTGSPAPDEWAGAEARIVITGKHANGQGIEIRGTGWIGYNDTGSIEGTFYDPPRMIIADQSERRAVKVDGGSAPEGKLLPFKARPRPPRSV